MARVNYLVYVGEEIKFSDTDYEKAKEEFDKLPSGAGKSYSKRRQLVKEEIILEDVR